MKLKHSSLLSKSRKTIKKPGFALIATLTLMMLLAMLAVGLMALVSSQNRIALQTILQAEARQQALVGLDVAIGELQLEMGPDRRVSANSGIISDSANTPQYILGVWDSWGGPLYGTNKLGKSESKIQSTYSTGRKTMFRRWLISTRNEKQARNFEGIDDLGKRRPGQRICMVGEGTLGTSLTQQHYIYADMITMPAAGEKNKTAYAWWIGGENQKAKISVENPKKPENEYEALRRTWDTPAPRFVNNSDLDYLQGDIPDPARVSTLASIPLVGTSSQSAGMPYFFDVTTTSFTLPVNVSMGGFKQDLCLLLNKKNLKETEFAASASRDCPIADNQQVPQGTEPNMPIGSWQNLHAFYNCWPNGEENDSDNYTARLIGNLDRTYTRMSGSIVDHTTMEYLKNSNNGDVGNANASYFDSRSQLEENVKGAGYARNPVMLAYMCNFGLRTELQSGKGAENERYRMSMTFAPMFLWWNPYNVPMRIRGRQLWSKSSPAKTMWLQSFSTSDGTNYKWGTYAMSETHDNSEGSVGFGVDWGEYFQANATDENGDIVFQPGEIIFFSPANRRAIKSDTFKNPWVPGYNPSSMSGNKSNFYSNKPADTIDGRWYVQLRFGQNDGGRSPWLEGWHFAPDRPECVTVTNGFSSAAASGAPDANLGKWGNSPQRLLLGWYDPAKDKDMIVVPNDVGIWAADGTQDDDVLPYYIASVGVVAKSANPNQDGAVFAGDYRGKIWQHSSPAFWGGALTNPDDQMRKYHPYQLVALPVSAGMSTAPMDNIGRNGFLGITSDGEQVSYASVLELPVHPPFSLAGFAGMRLQPGWYKHPGPGGYTAQGMLRRMQYQSGVPGVGIGNAFADPCLPADDVYTYYQNNLESSKMPINSRVFGDFFDHGLLINDALWDRWFCSSVSDMPDKDNEIIKAQDTLTKFLKGEESLPVSRYKKTTTPYSDEKIIQRIMAEDGWKHIAQYLMIDGGFNVNSTSVEAWAATLQGLAQRKLVANVDNKLSIVEKDKSDDQVLFTRFMLSTTDKSVDSLGGYSMMQGSSKFRNSGIAAAWSEVRMLEPESIRRLAEEMVKQVRKRGPFLSMSDFVNRRLEQGEKGLTGALQAAIDATDINRDFNEVKVQASSGNLFKNPRAAEGSLHTAAPGYLIQSDVLASLGNILTVRDDTFTVRAYGCVRNANDAVLAQAWCEAVVQRTMDYVDPSNSPGDVEYNPDGTKGTGLSDANKLMGRQFRIVSFKWLDHWDI